MINHIFIYWAQGFENAPYIVSRCLETWKIHNPTWTITELDDNNLHQYIDIKKEIPDIDKKNITKTAYSDIVRIFLLEKYGGVWCDATTFCIKPLNDWLGDNIGSGFFAFANPGRDRLLSTWFLYSELNTLIIKKWKQKTIHYWNNRNKMDKYFWFHYLFGNLYHYNTLSKKIWDLTPKLPANGTGPHSLHDAGLVKPVSQRVINHVDNMVSPLYKITYKYNKNKYNDDCNLAYLLNHIGKQKKSIIPTDRNISFIHIGKCGGTYIDKHFRFKERYHLGRNYKLTENYVIWIRNPLERFVSAFWYSWNIINTDIRGLDVNDLTLNNCLAPFHVKHKIKYGHAFSKRYDYLINYFKNPNNLSESLSCDDEYTRKLAMELMNHRTEHIFKGIGWYLYNGQFVKNNHAKIIFVGTIENMKNDVDKLSEIISPKPNSHNTKKIRSNDNDNDKFLSDKAIANLLEFYKDTDYMALQKLVEYDFISKKLFEAYHKYEICS